MKEPKVCTFLRAEDLPVILNGSKWQARQIMEPQPTFSLYENDSFKLPFWNWRGFDYLENSNGSLPQNMREHMEYETRDLVFLQEPWRATDHQYIDGTWSASARLLLRIVGIRAERLQSITEEDAVAEGYTPNFCENFGKDDWECIACFGDCVNYDAKLKYKDAWNDLYAKDDYGWDTNPWVWVYEFEKNS